MARIRSARTRGAASFPLIAALVLSLTIASSPTAAATPKDAFAVNLSEDQAELESGLTDVTISIQTVPAQAGANYAATLVDPTGKRSGQHGQLDEFGRDKTVFQITSSGSYVVHVAVLVGGLTTTGSLPFHGHVLAFPVFFIVDGSDPGALLHSVSPRRAVKQKITPYHGSLGGFGDPTAFADATGTVDPPERGCRGHSYHGTLYGKPDPRPERCGWGKTLHASDGSFLLFFLGTSITRELWAQELLKKGQFDLRDVTIATPRVRLVMEQIDAAGKTQRLDASAAALLGDRLQAADTRNVQAFDALKALSRGQGGAAERKTAAVALERAIEHEQFVVEHLAKLRLLHRADVPEFQLSMIGGYLPSTQPSDLCVLVSTTGVQPGASVLVQTVRTDGTTDSQVVKLDGNGRGKLIVSAPTVPRYSTEVTVRAFGSDPVVGDFSRFDQAPSGC